MKAVRFLVAASLLWLGGIFPAWSATIEDAKALVLKAADEISKVGPAKAYSEFLDRNGPFWLGETFVFVMNLDGVWQVYPPKPDAAGMSLISLTDVDGKQFVREMVEAARTKGEGIVEYKWKNPETGLMQVKVSFVKKVGDLVVAAGVFR